MIQHIQIVTVIDGLKVSVEYALPNDTDKFIAAFRELTNALIPFELRVKT